MHWEFSLAIIVIILICLAISRRNHRKREQWLKQIWEDVKAGKISQDALEDPKNGVIVIGNEGFTVTVHRRQIQSAQVKWDNIDKIMAFKRDMFTTDFICWQFHDVANISTVEVDEQMLGFRGLQKAVELHFGVKQDDWFQKVAVTAFATNMTTIWAK
jgi:hypothetical protein